MKIRIKGNSIRYRLNRNDVKQLTSKGYLAEHTLIGNQVLTYSARSNLQANDLSATFEENTITLHVPAEFLEEWNDNDVVGISSVDQPEQLYLLLEKDFVCLDETSEDQSDQYDNPKMSQ